MDAQTTELSGNGKLPLAARLKRKVDPPGEPPKCPSCGAQMLDRSRSFGTVYAAATDGGGAFKMPPERFHQGDRYFDGSGHPLDVTCTRAGTVAPEMAAAVLSEREQIVAEIDGLTAENSQLKAQLAAVMARLEALEGAGAKPAAKGAEKSGRAAA